MSRSPVKLISVSPCANLQNFINSYVTKTKEKTSSSDFLKMPNKFLKKQHNRAKSGFKTSLADWRELYDSRPKTQSFIFQFNPQKEKRSTAVSFRRKKFLSSSQLKHKNNSIPSFDSTQRLIQQISKRKNSPVSKTAFNFYGSPEKYDMQVVGNLTTRIGQKFRTKQNLNRRKMQKQALIKMQGYQF